MNRYQANVAQLLKEPAGSTRRYTLSEIADDPQSDDGLRGEVRLLRTGRGILVRALVAIGVQMTCSRCLEPFKRTLNLEIEEEYFPTINIITGLPEPVPEEVGAFTIDNNHVLDLSEAIRQYELLAIPMKPLCRKACAGLCAQCGRNLNQGRCSCSAPPDPRWAALKELVASGKITAR